MLESRGGPAYLLPMSTLYLTEREKAAARAVDQRRLDELVDEALYSGISLGLYGLHLFECGGSVDHEVRAFERALLDYAKAKAPRKREELRCRAWLAGRQVGAAVRAMIDRADKEDKERALFTVDDLVYSPSRFTEHMEIRINFDWRAESGGSANRRSITFVYDVPERYDYTPMRDRPKRKPSAAKVEAERQDKLYREWEHLRVLAIQAVHEFLQKGGDPSTIPERFAVTLSSRDRYLNNFSCDFWQEPDEKGVRRQPRP